MSMELENQHFFETWVDMIAQPIYVQKPDKSMFSNLRF